MSGIQVGAVLHNRYELTAVLGQGGMGTVYRAHDPMLDRPVAINVLAVSALGTDGQARLLREARAIARLGHPNNVAVHDADRQVARRPSRRCRTGHPGTERPEDPGYRSSRR